MAKKRWFSLGVVLAVLVAAVVVLQLLGGSDEASARQFATLDVMEGRVDVSRADGAFREARDGQSLSEGDVVRTGPKGRAEIEYFDGSITRLDWSTEFTLEELATLDNAARSKRIAGAQGAGGKTWNRVTRLTDSQSRFEVRTPTATGAVRGTSYATQCNPDGSCLWVVLDGNVVITSELGTVSLHAFDLVEVAADGTIGEIQHLTLEELIGLFPWIELNGCILDGILLCEAPDDDGPPPPEPDDEGEGESEGDEPPVGTEGDEPGTSGTDTPTEPEPEPAENRAPNAAFNASETSGPAPLDVDFTSRATDRDGDELDHAWSFGDGETSNETNPSHTFGPGVHSVTLTVTDPDGRSDAASLLISVGPPGAPVIGDHPSAETTDRSATFAFAAPGAAGAGVLGLSIAALVPTLGFQCSIDGGAFQSCASPITYDDLSPGAHRFAVRGIVAGVAGPSAPFAWQILDGVPSAANDTLATTEDGSAVADVLANDSDPDGDPLHIASVGSPGHGVAETVAGGIRYTPLANFNGADSFTYTVADGLGGTDAATVAVTVAPRNDGPSASNDAYSTPEDTPLVVGSPGVLDDDSDVDGDPLTAVQVTGPAHGTLSLNPNGSFTYAPDDEYSGPDSFTYRASDGTAESQTATVSLTVGPVNDAPTCADGSDTTSEDNALDGSLSCTDAEGGALTFALVPGGAPDHGSLTLRADGSFTYTPSPNFHGADAFTFEASDGSAESAPATFSITVIPVNDVPVCQNDSGTVTEDGTLNGSVACTDVDGDALAYSKVSGPAHGTAPVGAGGSFTYTPSPNFHGADAFDFRASDGTASDDATFAITVTPVNDAPVCTDGSGTVAEDGTLNGTLSCSDVDGDALTYAKVGNPAHGTVTIAANGSFSYSPEANYFGPDAFGFSASDGQDVASGTFSIMVTAVNDVPVCANDADTVAEDGSLSGTVSCTDADGDELTYAKVSGPSHGTGTVDADGSFSYTPNANYNGPDAFTFQASDDDSTSAAATFSITVTPINDEPSCANDSGTVAEDGTLNGSVACTDIDGDTLTYDVPDGGEPDDGSLTLNSDGTFSYSPDANFNGPDAFTFRASDENEGSDTATYSITVTPVNDDPSCANDSGTVAEDGTLNGSVACTDIDGDTLTYDVPDGGDPDDGSLTLNSGGTFSYSPDANFNGSDAFTFRASDGTATDTATYSITVTAVNDAPSATEDQYSTDEDTTLTEPAATGVLANDSDVDGDSLSAVLDDDVDHGTLTLNAIGSFSYTPAENFHGEDTFTYHASDGTASSSTVTVTITVGPVNDAPACADDSGTVAEDGTLNDSVVCTDVEGDPLTYAEVAGPADGSLTLNPDGTFSYSPDANFNGSDSFTFQASDGFDQSNVATYSITVTAVNDAPACENDSGTVEEDGTLNDSVACTDVEDDSLTYDVPDGGGPSHGSLTLNSDGTFSYSPDANYNGSDAFTFRASDGTDTGSATYSITVTAANDVPSCSNDSGTVGEDGTLNDSVSCSDVDGDTLTYDVPDGGEPDHGSLTLNADGTFSYSPDANYNGSDAFTFRASDGTDTSSATYSITVTAVNDPVDAVNDSATVNEDSGANAVNVLANDTDADGDTLTVTGVTQGTKGSAAVASGGAGVTYTPNANATGSDSFTYTASDGHGSTDTATVQITITGVNDPVDAVNDSATVNEDSGSNTILVLANDTDPDGDSLTVTAKTNGSKGVVAITAGGSRVSYTPNANATGADSFTYTASDGNGSSDTATVNVTITGVNDAPTCTNGSGTTPENTALNGSLTSLCQDVEGQALTYAKVGNPSHGSVTVNLDGSFTYTPATGYDGSDSFTFRANDGTANSNTATFSITVTAANSPPDAKNDNGGSVDPGKSKMINVLANDDDPDGDTLTISSVGTPTKGTAVIQGGQIRYTANANECANTPPHQDMFSYTISDGHGGTDTAQVQITVNCSASAASSTTGGSTDGTTTRSSEPTEEWRRDRAKAAALEEESREERRKRRRWA